ncbi:hypothetical protein SY83_09700 [Paenibacillus swuensis]|uniref:Signal peptidase I n=1 Tax=Paenibacillus swuensis TaxID=1178515 RepID=A0A172TI24_9BACL|nr:signal peptidase I [Paenibacillus swuensis]ANE46507.1 hypothetical protein SY83_09700 [Paenibacillus swuensis]
MTEQVLETNAQAAAKRKERGSFIRFVIVLALAWILIHNLFGLTRVSGHSMTPTLQDRDIVLINKIPLLHRTPKYGDVIIIHEHELGYHIIKRVIARGGDRVAIQDGIIYVNREPLAELYTLGESMDMPEVVIPSGELFVVGDNRTAGESLDSRDPLLGSVSVKDVKGYAAFSVWPWHSLMKPLQ